MFINWYLFTMLITSYCLVTNGGGLGGELLTAVSVRESGPACLTTWIKNRVPTRALHGISPYEAIHS